MSASRHSNLCRLCMTTGVLTDIFKMDGELSLSVKTVSCIDLQICPDDGLPSQICNSCEQNVKQFYKFKQKCIEIDSRLRSMINTTSKLVESDFNDIKVDIKLECEFISEINKDTMNDWLSDDSKSNLDMQYFENEFIIKQLNENDLNISDSNTEMQENVQKITNSINKLSKKEKNPTKKSYQCELCGRIFKVMAILRKHLVTHTGEKLFTCQMCPKKFTRAEHKTVHMRSHMGIRPFTCEMCGKSFTKRQDLFRHMRVHSDEKKYACPTCERRFKRSADIHSHMRTHTGARPYSCQTCDKQYTSHSGLQKHHRTNCKLKPEPNKQL